MTRQAKFTDLPALSTAPEDTDIIAVVRDGTTYKITWETLMSSVTDALGILATTDSEGNTFNPDSGTTEFAYGGAGPTGDDVTTITNVQGGVTRVQTFTYADNVLTDISQWVVQ